MTQAKVCMLGAFAAGKTSLVSRYVRNEYSEKYLTTVGVRIERKVVRSADHELDLVLWDLHGEDEFQRVRHSYLRGAAGCLFVVDGTRGPTLDTALRMQAEAVTTLGPIPCVFAINKADLRASWALEEPDLDLLTARGLSVILTSAKTSQGVEEAFAALVDGIAKTHAHG